MEGEEEEEEIEEEVEEEGEQEMEEDFSQSAKSGGSQKIHHGSAQDDEPNDMMDE